VCICENPSPIPAVARSGKFRCDLLRGVCRDYSLVVRVSWRFEKQDLSAGWRRSDNPRLYQAKAELVAAELPNSGVRHSDSQARKNEIALAEAN
jgi:hypothetical protein